MMNFQGPGIGRAPGYMVDDFEQLVRESDEITKRQLENWEAMRLEKARIEAEGKL
jgi:GMP synthase PP-ATPase subunit